MSFESVTDRTLHGDGGECGIRRVRVGRIQEAGKRARGVGLGHEVRRHGRRCPLRSQLREKEKIILGLERCFLGVPGLCMI